MVSLRLSKHPIRHLYTQQKPNSAIMMPSFNAILHTGSVTIEGMHHEERRETGVVTPVLSFRSRPHMELHFKSSTKTGAFYFSRPQYWDTNNNQQIEILEADVVIPVFSTSTASEHGNLKLTPREPSVTTTKKSNDIEKVVFHIMNMESISGPQDFIIETNEPSLRSQRLGLAILEADEWKVKIADIHSTSDAVKELKASGGYAITHVGEIRRLDGSDFSSDDTQAILEAIHLFLSLALGQWAAIGLATGFSRTEQIVFQTLGLLGATPQQWCSTQSWFDEQHSEQLVQTFPGFWQRWKDPAWDKAIRHGVYLYVTANSCGSGAGIDSGIILAYAALEKMAWEYCVRIKQIYTSEEFRNRKKFPDSAARIQKLLNLLSIPEPDMSQLPSIFNELGKSWTGGVDAIRKIRNGFVHADIDGEPEHEAVYEAWRLSLWYLDMIFLRVCGHYGKYGNRLRRRFTGSVDSVPWDDGVSSL